MSQALSAPPVPVTASANDDLGIDRAFVLSMARLPLIALAWIAINVVAHQLWNLIAPGTANLAPVVVVSAGMVLAAFIDGYAFKVPNWITLSLVLSGWGLGLLHDLNVAVDAGSGGLLTSLFGTALGFALLFPVLMIGGMGQGDVKMQMGFGAWVGAYFGSGHASFANLDAMWILTYAFCAGVIVGGVFGLLMMVLRRKLGSNVRNTREILTDLQVLMTAGPKAAAARAGTRRSAWVRLPYGVPLCVGFLGTLAYLHWFAV
jgi:prepilin peptidase CpaA